MKIKKIGIIAFPLDDLKTGIGRYIYRFLKGLKEYKSDLDITVYIMKSDRKYLNFLPKGWKIEEVKDFYKKNVLNHLWHFLASFRKLKKHDIIYFPAANRRMPLFYYKGYVGLIHDLGEYHFKEKYSILRNILVKNIFKWLSKNFEIIFTVSKSTKSDVEKFYNVDKIFVNYNGIEKNRFYPISYDKAFREISLRYNIKTPFILYVSRLEYPAKNHNFLIKVFEKLKNTLPDLSLIFIGSKWNGWEKIYKRMDKSPYKKDIYHFENIENDKLVYFYNAAKVYIHPSLWEGFGYPVVEAGFCKKCSLVYKISSLTEVVKNEKFTFRNEEECYKKTLELLVNKELNLKMAEEHYQYVQKFTLENHIRRFVESVENYYDKKA